MKFRTATRRGNRSHRHKQELEASAATAPNPLNLILPLCTWQSATECMQYDYYAKVVAHNIFCDKSSQFWQSYVLQCCHQLPVVKQSLLALSAAFRATDEAPTKPHYATSQQYESPAATFSKAIAMLRQYMSSDGSPSHAVVLTCAIILYAYAKVLGDQEAASTHLERAINIFDTWAISSSGHERPDDFRTIRTVLLLLDLSATIEDKARVPAMTQPGRQPTQFRSLEDVVHGYSVVCQTMMIFTIRNYKHILAGHAYCPIEILQEKDDIADSLAQWKEAVDGFVEERSSTGDRLSAKEEECLLAVMLQWIAGKCQLDEVLPSSTPLISTWDLCADQWLEYGNRILQLRRNVAKSESPTGKRRSLILSYAQCMLIFAGGTSLDHARSTALAMAAEAAMYDQLILPVDLSHIGNGRGHSDALHDMEQKQVFWTADYIAHNSGCFQSTA
ncbi:hypothetical protein PRZ48_010448 [Zasmidium cellare]|uniref:Uncharacterized protein n=1 Tax=Zasmidium cellare TaxID=395010 RepID=A0ABR0E8N8_ZASCE|nr:hypothetical protein PRZ48_010448 [Zasmidium cellare]